jgi:HAD superfamily hydrolase (TIGR01509 family)
VVTRACIFDMDGVLVDSGIHHRDAWRALLDELGATPSEPEHWRVTIGRPAEEAVPLLLGAAVRDGDAGRLAARKRALHAELARRGTLPVRGVVDFVRRLVAAGVPRAVGTSALRRDADALLRELGLRDAFDVVVTAEDVARGKPDPQVYRDAARRLAVPAPACVVFEDSLVGVQAARAAGMRAVGVTTAHTAAELAAAGAEHSIADFEGLTWPGLARP